MRTLVVYDSVYENTAIVAKAIADVLKAEVVRVGDVDPRSLGGVGFLIVGSPTHGGRPTPAIEAFLKAIPAGGLASVRVAAFDTRVRSRDRAVPLRMLMRLIGYAAPRIAKALKAKGGVIAAGPEGFIVDGREGPLRTGKRDRAMAWISAIAASSDQS